MMHLKHFSPLVLSFVLTTFILACKTPEEPKKIPADPLTSWNEGQTKTEILNFVQAVVDSTSPHFVNVPDRIAVFDNDGNLWSEQPLYFQLIFALDRIGQMAPEHPEWLTEQPFQAALENDTSLLKNFTTHDLLDLVMASHGDMTTIEFENIVTNWIKETKHPRFERPFTELVYQPMLELINFLKLNDFKVFIVSGGGIEFMRPWVEDIYGLPKDQVIGSSIKTEFVYEENGPVIRRIGDIDFIDDGPGKPIGIHKFIGRKPIFCSGNSDGDLDMMNWTASNDHKSFMLYLHHTDGQREWAYDRQSHIGKLDKGLDAAEAKSWTIIDMKKDWKVIYPFELKGQ